MNNYEFVADWAARELNPASKMLDYGCGVGQIVKLARAKGLDAYGCDVFYGGGGDEYSAKIPESDYRVSIFPMQDGKIPFPDESFDLVTNNQVFEHVEDLDATLAEVARVLRPGGRVLSLFPDKAIWREGHCGIPFAHRFSSDSRWREPYMRAMRTVGFGYFKDGKSIKDWSAQMAKWLDDWTHYRDIETIRQSYARHFGPFEDLEVAWFDARIGRNLPLPRAIKRFVALKYGARIFAARKPA